MTGPTLTGQLLRVQTLGVAMTCAILVAGTVAGGVVLLRRDQDEALRLSAASLCHAIESEYREKPADYLAAAGEAFEESGADGLRFELLDGSGRVLASEGDLPGWPAGGLMLRRSVSCLTMAPDASSGASPYRACVARCGPGHEVLVATQDTLSRSEVRRVGAALIGMLPLAALAGALAGRFLIRRRLRSLEQLREAAANLQARPDLSLGVHAEAAELAALERAFDTLLSRLGEALAREQRFSQDASHELRTSLTVLRGRLEMLERDRDAGETQRAGLRAALADLASLDRLVDALLLLARAESAELSSIPVNLCDLARDAARRQARIDAGSAPVPQVEAPDEILVGGSEELLARALANLVENARKFGGDRARIRISVSQDGGRATIAVADDGPGIPASVRPFVFDRFYRDPARRNEVPGTGLGLAVARAVALRHGGTIHTGPGPIGGEEIRIELPLLAARNTGA